MKELLEQVEHLREDWGEGFDEDVAAPLTLVVEAVRRAVADKEKLTADLIETEEERDDLGRIVQDLEDLEEPFEDLKTNLKDIATGVRTLEEVLERWEIRA
jgi:hypothetical protein